MKGTGPVCAVIFGFFFSFFSSSVLCFCFSSFHFGLPLLYVCFWFFHEWSSLFLRTVLSDEGSEKEGERGRAGMYCCGSGGILGGTVWALYLVLPLPRGVWIC